MSVRPAFDAEHQVGLRTAAALCAFAGNSLLTRLALGQMSIDAATLATVRLASGSVGLRSIGSVGEERPCSAVGSRRRSPETEPAPRVQNAPDGNLLEFLAMLPDPPQPELGVVDWNRWTRRSSSSESNGVGGGLPT
jgi:hypothetical protein